MFRIKRLTKKLLEKFGYQIKRLDNGFSFNSNLTWLKNYNINTVLDIGGNEGQYAKFIHDVFPRTKIYSFEPIPSCYQKLSKLSETINGLKTFNYALGDLNETIDFNQNVFTPSSSIMKMNQEHILNFPHAEKTNTIKIEVKKLDDIVPELELKCDVMVKIDVQGYEGKVVNGGLSFFSKIPKIVIVEASVISLYEQESSFADLFDMFRNMGFRYGGNLYQLYSPINGSILQVDSIFIR